MFEVQDFAGLVRAIGVSQAADQARDHVTGKIAYCHPFDLIDFGAINADAALVFGELSAIKYIENFVCAAMRAGLCAGGARPRNPRISSGIPKPLAIDSTMPELKPSVVLSFMTSTTRSGGNPVLFAIICGVIPRRPAKRKTARKS